MTRMLAGLVALGLALLAGGEAFADGRNVPAPIPVPAPVPIPEGFTYYLRGDLGWGFAGGVPDFSESGRAYGTGGAFAINPAGSFGFGGAPFTGNSTDADDVFSGSLGFGAYLSPHFRSDITFDFRGQQGLENSSTYTYATAGGTVNGTTSDTVKLRGTVGLINAYWDFFQRGSFSPYVGGGIGFVYNDISRSYVSTETESVGPTTRLITGTSRDNHLGLAAALMAGITLASDHRFVWDLSYRALYMDGGNVTTTLSNANVSTATVGSQWEHQIRIGVRANIW
jgi:opacity protein-like surface antigen